MSLPRRDDDRHIVACWARCLAEHADAAALTFKSGSQWSSWTYAELDSRSQAIARRLEGVGLLPGAAVGVVARRVPETVAALLAVLRAGGHYVPVDPNVPVARRRSFFEAVSARISVAVVGSEIVATPVEARDEPPAVLESYVPSPEDVAYVMFTSGSSGLPKGVSVPHRAVCRLVRDQDYLRFTADRVFLQAAPLGFDASTLEIWGPLLNGGRCVLYPEDSLPSAGGLREAIATAGVTTAWLTSSLFNAIVEHDAAALSGLQELVVGGEALSSRHVRQAMLASPATVFLNGYGPTENTTFTTCHRILHPPDPDERIPIGSAIRGTAVAVVDANLVPVKTGIEGELVAMGDGLAHGYVGDAELTKQRFVAMTGPDGRPVRAYRTGDFVVEVAPGVFDFRGRRDEQVKVHGYRVEPAEIERVLAAVSGVRRCRVVAQRDQGGHMRLMAYVVLQDQADVGVVQGKLVELLPAYMVPHQVVALPALPLNANGKLAPPPVAPSESAAPAAKRSGALLAAVLGAWREVLGRVDVDPDIGFFDAGGRSLDAIRLHDLLERELGVSVESTFAFEFPSARRQAEQLARSLRPIGGLASRRPNSPPLQS